MGTETWHCLKTTTTINKQRLGINIIKIKKKKRFIKYLQHMLIRFQNITTSNIIM